MMPPFSHALALTALCWIGMASGCASGPYQFGALRSLPPNARERSEVAVCRGRPNAVVDSVGWVWGIPGKILLWDRRVQNHHVSEETEIEVCQYLESNGLQDVRVRVNQYDPAGEWQRLVANKSVGAGWRYTFGTMHWLGYTLLPDRVFGDDTYNPYSNTLSIYSDVPALAVREAAYAKDVHNRKLPGTYAVVQDFSPLTLWHQTLATQDALGYYQVAGDLQQRQEAYDILSPQLGMNLGGVVDNRVGVVAGAVVGHVVGRVKSAALTDQPSQISHRVPADHSEKRFVTQLTERPQVDLKDGE